MEPVPDILIERAVELWRRAIVEGDWDNGDVMSNALVAVTRDHFRGADTAEKAGKWARLLVDKLKWLRDREGEPIPEADRVELYRGYTPVTYHFDRVLAVDYNVGGPMLECANAVGLHEQTFPCKSGVQMYFADRVCSSFGYRGQHHYHYPLPDGRWLITDLMGERDMPKIIDAIMAGTLHGFEIEDAPATAEVAA